MAVNAAINDNAAQAQRRRKLGILSPRSISCFSLQIVFFRLRIPIQALFLRRAASWTRYKEPHRFLPVISSLKNGLYSVHIQMGDGVKGRASGVIVLRDGVILGGDPYFWSVGSYTVKNGAWKGDLVTNQHTPYRESPARPVFGGREVTTGFSGTFKDDNAEVFGTSLVGSRSVSFRATLRKLADI